jgi:23S rRNA pseudouridine1911/1915/1917 synthase
VIDKPLVEGRDLSVRPARPGQPGARDALTRFRTLCVQGGLALLEVAIETGRKHQIRVHLASLGHPLVGDVRYGGPAWGRRVALHACSLRFPHPVTGQWVEVESRAALDPPVGFR